MSKDALKITIGPRWTAFTYERDDMQLLGTVQRGMQIGALARTPDGNYAQVNGDIVEMLSTSRVLFALRASHGKPAAAPVGQSTAAPTIVTVKKRRRIVAVPPGSSSSSD
jgi:hypothetical protein